MAEIVNLRQARKRKAKNEAEKKAESNRQVFGSPKAEKALKKATDTLDEKRLDGHRLDD